MKKPYIYEIPKDQWENGPWQSEPDYEEFIYKNTLCVLNRGPVGAWNGYIAIPKNNKWANDISYDLNVHGGVTYTSEKPPFLHENYEKNKEFPLFWIGFDCAHYLDIIPSTQSILKKIRQEMGLKDNVNPFDPLERVYRTIDYARNECKKLVDQIIEVDGK